MQIGEVKPGRHNHDRNPEPDRSQGLTLPHRSILDNREVVEAEESGGDVRRDQGIASERKDALDTDEH